MRTDKYKTGAGEIEITVIGHGSLMFGYKGKVIYVDPYSKAGDYSQLPRADLILITHGHYDHYDPAALALIMGPDTEFITNPSVEEQLNNLPASPGDKAVTVLRNGDKTTWNGIAITAVPAYNIVHMRAPGEPYHPKGDGNGYLLEVGGLRIYIAGDAELIPEMEHLGAIDIAFVPKNLPYTMSDQMFIEAVRTIKPRIVYPYHYSGIDPAALKEALPSVEIKIP